MQIREVSDPLEEIGAEVLVLFHLEDEPAPRGRLGQVDWILCGALSRLRARGKFAGECGRIALLSPEGKLKTDKVLVIGLGHQVELSAIALYRLSYQAAQAVLHLGCTRIALEPPFRAFPDEVPARVRHAFLEAFLAELRRGQPAAGFAVAILAPRGSC